VNVGFLVGGCLVSLIAVGLLIGAAVVYVRQGRKSAERVSAQGIVVGLQRRVTKPGSAGVHCPVVEFRLPDGQTIRFESAFGTMPASHKVGQNVTVLYNPANPQDAEVSSALSRYLFPGTLAFMGTIALCLGVSFLAMTFFLFALSTSP
jgi:hypothetical protein